jgi:AcrR family transcriptional regulator
VPKWTRRADKRPEELALAALELCAERGVHATRVADVAERAGVTVGTVYRYFRDKDALIEAALRHAAHPSRRTPVPDRPGATLPALADALRRWGGFFRDSGARSLRVALSDPRRDVAATDAVIGEAVQEIADLLTVGIARHDIRADLAPDSVARALVGALLFSPVLSTTAEDADRDIEALSALATRGLRGDGPSWRATT